MAYQTGVSASALTVSNPWAMTAPLGNLDAYISAANRMPMLTLEDEQAFARQFRQNNDLDAAGKLGFSHLRMTTVEAAPPAP